MYAGGHVFNGLIALILVLAAREYVALFKVSGQNPARGLVMGGVLLVVLGRVTYGFEGGGFAVSLLLLASMAQHLFEFERGRDQAGTDFGVTVAGVLYLGWIGAYLISVRALPDGEWWLLLILLAVWLADSGAYLVGSRFGRRSLSARLSASPKEAPSAPVEAPLFSADVTADDRTEPRGSMVSATVRPSRRGAGRAGRPAAPPRRGAARNAAGRERPAG